MPFRTFPVRDVAANMQETAKQIRYNGNCEKYRRDCSFCKKGNSSISGGVKLCRQERERSKVIDRKEEEKFICVELLVMQEVRM